MAHVMRTGRNHSRGATDWMAGIWAGLIAGAVFMMLEMILVRVLMGESPWNPPYMMAAMVLGQDTLPAPGEVAPFDMKIMMLAMMIHSPLSIAYGLLGAWLCRGVRAGGALVVGAMLGIAIYILSFYLVAPTAFPWFTMARNGVSAFSHLVFGVVLGVSYVWLRKTEPARAA